MQATITVQSVVAPSTTIDAPAGDPDLLEGPEGAHLVAYVGGSAEPQGWWPNDDRDAFAVALGQQAIALGLVDDDQEDDDANPSDARSLVGFLDSLSIQGVGQ